MRVFTSSFHSLYISTCSQELIIESDFNIQLVDGGWQIACVSIVRNLSIQSKTEAFAIVNTVISIQDASRSSSHSDVIQCLRQSRLSTLFFIEKK